MAAIYPWALAFVDDDFPGTEASACLQQEVSKVLPTGCVEKRFMNRHARQGACCVAFVANQSLWNFALPVEL